MLALGASPELPLRIARAHALVNAGRGAEAADEFRRAAAHATGDQELDLQRRAAQQWLYAGHFAEGIAAFELVLSRIGLRLPQTPRQALLQLAWRRFSSRLRGTRLARVDAGVASPSELLELDILWSVATGLSLVDTVRGADFQTLLLRRCLAVGEPLRACRALALEACYVSTSGAHAAPRADALLQRADAIASDIDDAYGTAFCKLARAACQLLGRGAWRDATTLARDAEARFGDHCTGVSWELSTAAIFLLRSKVFLGELGELVTDAEARVRNAGDRGDLCAVTGIQGAVAHLVWLARDDAAEAERQIRQADAQWPAPGFQVPDFYVLTALAQIDLYRGEGDRGLARFDLRWAELARSKLPYIGLVRVETRRLRAMCAIQTARSASSPLLARAERDARALSRDSLPWGRAFGAMLHGSVAAARGDDARALSRLATAARQFDAADMALFAAACRVRIGELQGGDAGAQLRDSAMAVISARGAAAPEHMVDLLCPVAAPRVRSY